LLFNAEIDSTDGKLYMHEIYNLPLANLQLAVLSACQSGTGRSMAGEGTFSIARAFTYAGTSASVLSLWEVDDESTSLLMSKFYHQLGQGVSISKALQQAKVSFLESENIADFRPYFWAAFVPYGHMKTLVLTQVSLYLRLTGFVVLLVAGLYFYRQRRISITSSYRY
jgi:CHAT domain-containing protein